MEYNTNQDLYNYFTHEIERIGEQQIEALRKEMDEKKRRELKRINDEIEKKMDKYLDRELRSLNTDFSSEINRIHTENHRKLMDKRRGLLQEVFSEAEKKIQNFVESKDYRALMKKQVQKALDFLDAEDTVFVIKEDDETLRSVLKDDFENAYEIETDGDIRFGGFKAKSQQKGLETDETFTRKLEEQKEWFYANSNLFIRH
ncbi:MAG: V-type ATP synthase subunit E [Bacillota bacterium]